MVTQGVQPGQVQFYQSGYNAQNGDLVSSKVVVFAGDAAGKLYNGTKIIAAGPTGAFRLPDFQPNEFGEMCNREYQGAGGDTYTPTDPETNNAYGATVGTCTFIRMIARAIDAAGPNPTREDLAAAVEGLGAIDTGGQYPGSFGPGQVHGAERAEPDDVELPVRAGQDAVRRHVHHPRGRRVPDPDRRTDGHRDRRPAAQRPGGTRGRRPRGGGAPAGGPSRALGGDDPPRRPVAGRRRRRDGDRARRCAPAARRW